MDGRSKFGFTTMTRKSSLQPLGTAARPSVTSFRHDVVFRNMSVRTQCNCRSKTEQRHRVCPAPSLDGTCQKKAWQNFTWCFLPVLCSVRQPAEFFIYKITGEHFFIQYGTKPSCVVLQELVPFRSDVKPSQCPNPKNH